MKKTKIPFLMAALLSCAATPAYAHVTLSPEMASPGAYYKGVLGVPHGCDGADTTGLSVTIPEGVISVKPMLKPGWIITTETGKYARSYKSHRKEIGQGVTRITWSGGSVPDDRFDEFVFMAKLPDDKEIMRLFFPVTQICGPAKVEWDQIAPPDEDAHKLKNPAPVLDLMGDMDHGHMDH